MAFRLGHQISCNIKQNPIFRSLSVDSSRHFKSAQNIAINKKQNGCCSIFKEKKIHLPRARSLPSETNMSSLSYRMFSSRKPSDSLTNDSDYVTEYNPQHNYVPQNVREQVELVVEPKMTLPDLQPTNINPVVNSHIREMSARLSPPMRTQHRRQVTELKRLAAAKYERAVRSFNSEDDSDVYRYQLEAAIPKNENLGDVYGSVKRMLENDTVKTPQLQPKNIKPYGNMDTPHWTGPNVERAKQSIVLQDLRRNKFESILEKRKRSASAELQSDSSKASASHTQQRDYCTITKKMSPDLEKCKATIAEYKNLNPAYSGKTTKIVPGSEEEKRLLEEAEKLVATIKNSSKTYGMTTAEPKITANPESLMTITTSPPAKDSIKGQEIDNKKSEALKNEIANSQTPKLNLPQASDTKTILFYDEKNKRLCSKVVRTSNDGNSSEKPKDDESASRIKIKIGPKLMLQSTDLSSPEYRMEDLKPAANEKFIAPWLSWSDRVKMQIKPNRSPAESPVKDAEEVIKGVSTNTTEDKRQPEIQKRQYSWMSTLEDFNTVRKAFFQQQPKVFNDGEKLQKTTKWADAWHKSNLKRDDSIHKCNSEGAIRSFSTECTRGVLGPEATVMVKLRRLPKMNLPEPEKECEKLKAEPCYRADGEIRVAQKKLPKLVLQPCKVPIRSKMRLSDPIPRPKRRHVPEEPPKICVKKICDLPRADDGMVVTQKKLPKLVTRDCFPKSEQKMTSPPLPRLVPRPMPPPPPCPDLLKDQCPPRADEGLQITRKKLPILPMPDCDKICPTGMTQGEPLKRLKKVHIPEPRKTCLDLEDPCPPRADETTGYKIKKKKLQSLILGEKYNDISWKEFNSKRNFASDSKCSMCCFSDKKVQPDIKAEKEEDPSEWSKFKGRILCEGNGKLAAYLPPEETIDTSTGSELKIVKKPIGTSFRKDEHLHEELLKGGFTSINTSNRKFCSSTNEPCVSPPSKPPYKDLRLKRLKKRKGFYEDFPGRLRFRKLEIEKECIDECSLMVRMDDAMKYEVKPKKLPRLPEGNCPPRPKRIPKESKALLRRPRKKQKFRSYDCPKEECVDHCPPRADESYVEKYNKLIPMNEISKTCQRPPPPSRDEKDPFRPLPKVKVEEPKQCEPPPPCNERVTRADHKAVLYRKKTLPPLNAIICPRPRPRPMKPMPKMRRLPKTPPYEDRAKRGLPECMPPECYLSDEIYHYKEKVKKLKPLLKSNNKAFSTFPTELLYMRNFHSFESNRHFSSSPNLLNSEKRECKKLAQPVTKKCPKVNLTDCKPAKSISCARRVTPRLPCTKQKSPYPAFSECHDHQRPDIITECKENEKMLQPRWPILSEIKSQKPPPPYQGKIDPTKQEECIAKKLNIIREGETKTCENFDEPEKPILTKEMYDEVMRNPPYDECECANQGQDAACPTKKDDDKGPCKPKDLSVCKDPEIECILNEKPPGGIACAKTEDESEERSLPCGKVIGKLTCQKKGAEEEDCDEDPKDECKEAQKPIVAKQSAKEDCTKEKAPKPQKAKTPSGQRKPCEKPPSDCKESQGAAKKTKTSATKCGDEKSVQKKGSDCSTAKGGGKDSKKKIKVKKVKTKRRTPKKCSDILKEEDKKVKRKATGKKKPQMADLCKKKKKSSTAKMCKPKKAAVKKPAVCVPAKKSLWQRIMDYFKARPNCPAPDQWKKDKLRKQAEKAAAAAGLELCEKKKPKEVTVNCKKTGIRRTAARQKTECKKIPTSCSGAKAQPKKKTSKPEASDKCKKVKQECSQSKEKGEKKVKTSCTEKKPPKKPPSDSCGKAAEQCKPKVECKSESKAKIPQKARSSGKVEDTCPAEEDVEEECEEECEEAVRPGGKCKVLPKQKFCKPRARKSCVADMSQKGQCTPQESPYACYSDCKKVFPKIPMTECTEQEKNVKRKTVTFDYDDPSKQQTKHYSTLALQKRFYSSGSNGWKDYDPLSFLDYTTDDPLNNIDNNELALKILTVLKEGMKNLAKPQSATMNKNCVDIFKELELLCEQELNKNLAKDPTSKSKLLSGVNLDHTSPILNHTNFIDMEQRIMMETAKNFCKTMFLMPDSSTEEYEELEKAKTREFQKKLDEMLSSYKS